MLTGIFLCHRIARFPAVIVDEDIPANNLSISLDSKKRTKYLEYLLILLVRLSSYAELEPSPSLWIIFDM